MPPITAMTRRASLLVLASLVAPAAFALVDLGAVEGVEGLIPTELVPLPAHVDGHDDEHDGGHYGEHGDQHGMHDPCQVDVSPYGHAVNDGHAHYHHSEAVGAHWHGDTWHGEHHTHGGGGHGGHGGHGGAHGDGCDQTGMARMMFEDQGPIPAMDLNDAVVGHTPSVIVRGEAYAFDPTAPVDRLIWTSDEDLANAGLPGSGTMMDPYIIENRFVTEKLEIRNTDACVVVRNNVATGNYLKGPLASPDEVRDLAAAYEALKARVKEAWAALAQARLMFDAARWAYVATGPAFEAYQTQDQRARTVVDAANEDVRASQRELEALRLGIASARELAADAQRAMAAEADVPDLGDDLLAYAEEVSRDFPQYRKQIRQIRQAGETIASARQLLDELRARLDDEQTRLADARSALTALETQYADAIQARQDAQKTFSSSRVAVRTAERAVRLARNQASAGATLLEQGTLEYAGQVFKDLDALVAWLLQPFSELVEENAQIVLDWNGTCVHAYHNVADDLRVNQNNGRTGYATGGLIENNRFHDIGQLRHYDGVFRENEVGDRRILANFLNGETWTGDRAINVDGFNQGMLTDNTFYGRVDLDFHGHHHGSGFFSPHSHYHGNDKDRLYGPDGQMRHDHTQRWTSVRFADNLVIDPAGAGIRYEDRNHAGDDRKANSENVEQLNEPHIHRSLIELHDNVVVGSVFVDVFNADGIEVWSDDYSQVRYDAVGRILDAVKHLGADIISTHRARNNGWLSIAGNRIIDPSGGLSAITVQVVKEAEIDIANNSAASIGVGARPDSADFQDMDLSNIDWGGTDEQMDSAILLRGLKDSLISVCGNEAFGFDRGLTATHGVQDDAPIRVCEDNQIGSVNIVYTPRNNDFTLGDFLREQVADLFGDAAAHVVGGAVEPLPDVPYRQGH